MIERFEIHKNIEDAIHKGEMYRNKQRNLNRIENVLEVILQMNSCGWVQEEGHCIRITHEWTSFLDIARKHSEEIQVPYSDISEILKKERDRIMEYFKSEVME